MNEIVIPNKNFLSEPTAVWRDCLRTIKENVTLMTYNTWFVPIKPIELQSSTLKVQLPSQFFWEWVDEHYNTLINKTIHDVLGPEAKLAYVISDEIEVEEVPVKANNISANPPVNSELPKPKQDFESF